MRSAAEARAEAARRQALDECLAIARLQVRAAGDPMWCACAEHIAAQIEALKDKGEK